MEKIKVGDMLSLQREDNKFDSNAILILNEEGKKLGYVPEKDNIVFARLMDAGKLLKAKISSINQKGSFTQIGVGIYLVDL
ncbi:MAG: HIRAN domain-containing protein [Lachnospiraceae bacterium]|nr:HIRAN domain-containing protein [Lachnospiraceae bacterium]